MSDLDELAEAARGRHEPPPPATQQYIVPHGPYVQVRRVEPPVPTIIDRPVHVPVAVPEKSSPFLGGFYATFGVLAALALLVAGVLIYLAVVKGIDEAAAASARAEQRAAYERAAAASAAAQIQAQGDAEARARQKAGQLAGALATVQVNGLFYPETDSIRLAVVNGDTAWRVLNVDVSVGERQVYTQRFYNLAAHEKRQTTAKVGGLAALVERGGPPKVKAADGIIR